MFQIVGHSLGAGTAALLTYILREQPEFSSMTCVAFAPGSNWFFFQGISISPCRFLNLVNHVYDEHWRPFFSLPQEMLIFTLVY